MLRPSLTPLYFAEILALRAFDIVSKTETRSCSDMFKVHYPNIWTYLLMVLYNDSHHIFGRYDRLNNEGGIIEVVCVYISKNSIHPILKYAASVGTLTPSQNSFISYMLSRRSYKHFVANYWDFWLIRTHREHISKYRYFKISLWFEYTTKCSIVDFCLDVYNSDYDEIGTATINHRVVNNK